MKQIVVGCTVQLVIGHNNRMDKAIRPRPVNDDLVRLSVRFQKAEMRTCLDPLTKSFRVTRWGIECEDFLFQLSMVETWHLMFVLSAEGMPYPPSPEKESSGSLSFDTS